MITFDQARPYLEAALSYAGDTHTFEDVAALISQGRLQFWPGVTSAIVTEIIEYPRTRTLHFFLAGGNLPELQAMYPLVIEWGRGQGCTTATLTGRKGWTRSFLSTAEGWNESLVVMTKDLHDE